MTPLHRILFAIAIGGFSACTIGPKQEDPANDPLADAGAADSEFIGPFDEGGVGGDASSADDTARAVDASTSADTGAPSPPCAPSGDTGDAACGDAASDGATTDASDAQSDAASDASDAMDGGDVATGG